MKKLIVALAALSMMGVYAFADSPAPTATQPAVAAQPASATPAASKSEKRMTKKGSHLRVRHHKRSALKKNAKKVANDASKQ